MSAPCQLRRCGRQFCPMQRFMYRHKLPKCAKCTRLPFKGRVQPTTQVSCATCTWLPFKVLQTVKKIIYRIQCRAPLSVIIQHCTPSRIPSFRRANALILKPGMHTAATTLNCDMCNVHYVCVIDKTVSETCVGVTDKFLKNYFECLMHKMFFCS